MRRILPLVVVVLAALPQAAFAGQWYRCRYTGETRASCCCPDRARSADGGGAVSRADCCELRRTEPTALQAREPASASESAVQALPAAAPPPLDLEAWQWAEEPIARATAPPPTGQPIYLRHSSLLL